MLRHSIVARCRAAFTRGLPREREADEAGLVAERYRARGGIVVETGKPGALIYCRALDKAERLRGRSIEPARVLGIGDTVALDVAGALSHGFAALQIGAAPPPPADASARLYRMPALVW